MLVERLRLDAVAPPLEGVADAVVRPVVLEVGSQRDESAWIVDVELTRELRVSPHVWLELGAAVHDLLDARVAHTYDARIGSAVTSEDATRDYGRRLALGATLQF